MEEEAQTLIEFGLTPLQAKVYMALINLENPTAKATAKLSKVARQEVYRITNELAEMGIVSMIITTPTKFQPLPLSQTVSLLLERRMKKTAELQEKASEMMKKAKEGQATMQKNYQIREFPEKGPWFKIIHKRFETFKTFDLLTTFQRFSARMIHDEELYQRAVKRGTKIRILLGTPPQRDASILSSINSLTKYPNFEIRHSLTPTTTVLIIMDQNEIALALLPSNVVGPPYLCSDHPSLVHVAQQYFETKWNGAKIDIHSKS
jgi:sugar-specific transcriptional regulator TrmB